MTTDEPSTPPSGITRRKMLKRMGAGAAVAWTVPVLTSIRTPAFAQASGVCAGGCDCGTPSPCCGAPGGEYFCHPVGGGKCFCSYIPGVPCLSNADCAGCLCVDHCGQMECACGCP